jgi:uncharacterized membrane protein
MGLSVKGKTRSVALIAMFTAAYVAIVEVLPFISYGEVNIRVADILYGLLPFFPGPMVLASGLATFLSDMTSPFGAYDFIGSTLVILGSAYVATLIFRLRFKGSVLFGYCVFAVLLATWLTTLISSVSLGQFHLFDPTWFSFAPFIYGGDAIADAALPYLFCRAWKKRFGGPQDRQRETDETAR